MRIFPRSFCSLLVLFFLSIVASGALRAEDNAAEPKARNDGEIGYLMLQDGGLIEGKITPAADWYVIARSGGQLQIAKSRVIFACRTLEDAYAYRRKEVREAKPEPHLGLAEW